MGENAAIVNLGGKVLLLLTKEADLIVLPANAKVETPVAQYYLANRPTWGHPVVIGNRILIKDETTLRSLTFQNSKLGGRNSSAHPSLKMAGCSQPTPAPADQVGDSDCRVIAKPSF